MKFQIIILCLLLPNILFAQSNDADKQEAKPTYQDEVERIAREYPEESRAKGTGWKQQERWKENMYYYTDKSGKLYNTKAKTQKELSKYESTHPEMKSNQLSNGSWENMGGEYFTVQGSGYLPGVGRLNSFASDPQNSSMLYVGSAAGGLWKSPDAGSSWESLTDGMASSGVSGIAISHQNSNNIYILTGDGDAKHTYSTGIMKSLDGGATWQATGLAFGEIELTRGYCLIIDPNDELHQVAGISNGVYETTDGWATWSKSVTDWIYDLEFKPGDSQTVYAASDREVYISTDGGVSFDAGTIVAPFYPVLSNPDTDGDEDHRIELAVTAHFPENVYLHTGARKNGFIGLYQSVDSGISWSPLSTGGINLAANILNSTDDGTWATIKSQAHYDLSLAIAPSNPSAILSGGVNLWGKDMNGNNSWDIKTFWNMNNQPTGSVYMHADIHELVYVENVLYCCNDGGLYKSTDHGETWTDLSAGLVISQFYKIDSADGINNKVIGGTQDNGTNRIDDSTAPNMAHVLGGDGMGAKFQRGNPTNAYCTQQYGNLFFSTDGGVTFDDISQAPGGGKFVTQFDMIGTGIDLWYGGVNGLYLSEHNIGTLWNHTMEDNTITPVRFLSSSTGSTTHVVYFAHHNLLRYREYDTDIQNLISSGDIHNGLPTDTTNISSVTTNQEDNAKVLTTFSGYVSGEKIYYSDDMGSTWTNISDSLPNVPVFCAEFEPGNNGGIYVGTDIGVFYRNDDMTNWVYFSNNLPRVPVRDLDFVASENKLRAATFGRSVWQTTPYTNCPNVLVLFPDDDDNYIAVENYEANNLLGSTAQISGGPGTNVTYTSGQVIYLNDGFEVTQFSEFKAQLGPCGTTIPPPIPPPADLGNDIQSNSLNSEQ